jgi:hypothetical protein
VIDDVKDSACPGENDICGTKVGVMNRKIHKFDARLAEDSPAIDSGLPVGGIVPGEDYDGILRPIGDGVDRGAFESLVVRDNTDRACRKEIRKRLRKHFKSSVSALQRCAERVIAGSITGPCPDEEAQEAVARAARKVDPEQLSKKCPDETLGRIDLGGSCAQVDSKGLASCIIAEAEAAAEMVVDLEYSQQEAPLPSAEEVACQKMIARRLGKPYGVRRLKLFEKCMTKLDKGILRSCLDSVSQERLLRVERKVEKRIGSKCTDELVRTLQERGGFPRSCSLADTVSTLASCQIDEHDAETDRLVSIVPASSAEKAPLPDE